MLQYISEWTSINAMDVQIESEPLIQNERPKSTKSRSYKREIYCCMCSCLGPLSLGFSLGYTSPTIPQLLREGRLSNEEASWFGSLLAIGALFGGPLAGILVEYCGRKTTAMISCGPSTIGWFIVASSKSAASLCVGRLFTGLGGGMISLCVPMYIAETASKNTRGSLGASFQIGTTSGILLVYIIGQYVNWQWLAVIAASLPCIFLFLMLTVTETARWYYKQGENIQGFKALSWLRNAKSIQDIEGECEEIKENIEKQKFMEKFSLSEFKQPKLYKPLIISLSLMVFQQFCGINAVIFYTETIFEGAGYKTGAGTSSIIIAAVKVAATIVSTLLMDRVGRRKLSIIGGLGMAVSCITFGAYFYLTEHSLASDSSLSWLSLGSLIVYVIAFSIGWGAIPWLIMSEIFPVRARGYASSIATVVNWLGAFIVTKEFLGMASLLTNYGIFWAFGGVSICSVLFVSIWLPETKCKSLEEIEQHFST